MRLVYGVGLLLVLAGAARLAAEPRKEGPVVVSVELAPQPLPTGEQLTVTISATNRSDQNVALSFRSGQRFDVRVMQGKTEVWRWSRGRFFTQVLGMETLKAGETKKYTTTWNQKDNAGKDVAPGAYTVIGSLATRPLLESAPATLTIQAAPGK